MDYNKYNQKTKEILQKFGATCSIVRKVDEVYNVETNEYTSVNEVIDGKAILSTYDINLVNNTTIESGDISLLCWLPSKPKVSDEIEFSGKKYVIKFVNPCNVDGKTDIFFEVQAR